MLGQGGFSLCLYSVRKRASLKIKVFNVLLEWEKLSAYIINDKLAQQSNLYEELSILWELNIQQWATKTANVFFISVYSYKNTAACLIPIMVNDLTIPMGHGLQNKT